MNKKIGLKALLMALGVVVIAPQVRAEDKVFSDDVRKMYQNAFKFAQGSTEIDTPGKVVKGAADKYKTDEVKDKVRKTKEEMTKDKGKNLGNCYGIIRALGDENSKLYDKDEKEVALDDAKKAEIAEVTYTDETHKKGINIKIKTDSGVYFVFPAPKAVVKTALG